MLDIIVTLRCNLSSLISSRKLWFCSLCCFSSHPIWMGTTFSCGFLHPKWKQNWKISIGTGFQTWQILIVQGTKWKAVLDRVINVQKVNPESSPYRYQIILASYDIEVIVGIIFLIPSSHEAGNSTISLEVWISVVSLHGPGLVCPFN